MKPAVARWLEFAEIDLKAARTLLKEGSLSPVVCFHAQQSVEKGRNHPGLKPPAGASRMRASRRAIARAGCAGKACCCLGMSASVCG